MKKLFFLVLLFVSTDFPAVEKMASGVGSADQWFDSYQELSWQEEQIHLSNFAMFLKSRADTIGYIAYCGVSGRELSKKKGRAQMAKKYLVSKRGIKGSRIVLVQGNRCELTSTILQPVLRSAKIPQFFD